MWFERRGGAGSYRTVIGLAVVAVIGSRKTGEGRTAGYFVFFEEQYG